MKSDVSEDPRSPATRCRRVLLTCGSSGAQEVDVPVEEGQLLDDATTQPSVLQHVVATLVDGVSAVTLAPKHAVTADKVLTEVHLGAVLLEAAAVFVIVQTHLRQEDTGRTPVGTDQ